MSPTISEVMTKIPAVFRADRAADIEAVVHFKFTGPEAGEWNAAIRNGSCEVAQGIPRTKPSVSVVADSADFIRIVTGELDGMQAFMNGTLRITGDLTLAPRLVALFRIP